MAIRLGDIDFGISADSKELRAALKMMDTFGQKVDKVARRQSEGAQKSAKALAMQEKAITTALIQTEKLSTSLKRMGANDTQIQQLEKAFRLYTNQLTRGEVKTLTFLRANERLKATYSALTKEVKQQNLAIHQNATSVRQAAKEEKIQAAALEKVRIKTDLAAQAARELHRVRQRTTALQTGGQSALNTVNGQFSRDDQVRNYGRSLQGAGVVGPDMSRRTAEYRNALEQLDRVQAKVTKSAGRMNGLFRDTLLIGSAASGPLGLMAAQFIAVAEALERTELMSRRTSIILGGVAVAATATGISMVKSALEIDRARAQFTAITGAVELSNLLLKEAQEIADKSGQSFERLAKQYARFNAAATKTTFQGQKAKEMFTTLSMVIGQLQLPADQAEGVLRAVEQMMSKGKVQAEELRNQLGDRLPGAFAIASRAMGTTTAELSEMLKKGLVLSEDFLPKFTQELKNTFSVNGEIDNLNASINRAGNAFTIFLAAFDDTIGLSAGFKNVLDGVTASLAYLTNNMNTIIPIVGAFGGALIALNMRTVVTSVTTLAGVVGGALTTGFRTVAAAVAAFNAALLANPLTGIISLLWRVVAVVGAATAGWLGFKSMLDDTAASMNQLHKQTQAFLSTATKVGGVGGTAATLMNKWADEGNKAGMRVMELRAEIEKLQNSSKRFLPNQGFALNSQIKDAQTELKLMEEKAKKSFANVRAIRETEAENQRRIQAAAKVNIPKIKTTKTTSAKKSTADAEARKAARELEKQLRLAEQRRKALNSANDDISKLDATITALESGGIPALEKLNAQFAKDDAVERYAAKLRTAAVSQEELAKRLGEYSDAYDRQKRLMTEQEREIALAQEIEKAYTRAYDNIADSLADMIINGKADFESFQDTIRNVLADLARTAIQLQVINPLKQELFGTGDQEETSGSKGYITQGLDFLGDAFKGYMADTPDSDAAGNSGDASSTTTPEATKARLGMVTGPVKRMRTGGLINTTTMFNTPSGNVVGGEAGTEAIMPLRRNSRGELGVVNNGGGSSNIVVNIQTPDPQSFKASSAQIASRLRRAVSNSKNGA